MAMKPFAWFCDEVEPEELADACKKALRKLKFQKISARRAKNGVVVGGIFGSPLMALLVRLLPFGQYLPWGNRYRAELKAGTYKERTRLRMEVFPIMELFNQRESLLYSQDLGEAVADSIHASRLRNKLQLEIEARVGAMEPLFTAHELKKRGKKRGRRRR